MTTIKHIAQKAGVSPTTVSNVIHGNTARVSPLILEKVRKILLEENYVPNMGAVILARNNSRLIGVILFMEPRSDQTVLEDPFASSILGTLEREIRNQGYFMLLYTTVDKNEVLRLVATWKLDGLIMLWVPGEVATGIKTSISTPVVFVDCYYDDGNDYHNIGLDDEVGGYEMASYLISKGHTKIAFLANSTESPSVDTARFSGCQRAVSEQGFALTKDSFISVPKSRTERHALYHSLIKDPRPYSALFFSSDYYAADAITYFNEHDISVPEDISVAGFDDNSFSRLIRPRLTTVHQDVFKKGQRAVSMLMSLMRKKAVETKDDKLPVRLVIRDSVMQL
ncbi:MAG: LacI family DNA-binding transcriptional regulator [Spirochaetia bacterium]|jgi:LacI family transcriptional regulator|nr:LacI family DNA-binding transcriptional regulator [Spirochaetia bacterium]